MICWVVIDVLIKRMFMKLKFMGFVIGFALLFSSAAHCRYWIRDAIPDDKRKIVDLYKRSKGFYGGGLADVGHAVFRAIPDFLYVCIDEGFAFVVESLVEEDNGRILGFLLKERSLHATHRHIVCGGLMAIDPDFKKEMLGVQLYQYLLEQVEEHYPDILRVEGCCHEFAVDDIALFEVCGFVCEGRRERAVLLAGRSIADELCFVWWNRYFTPSRSFA